MDATTLEADAALRSIVRRDAAATYQEFLTQLAQPSGIETPAREQRGPFPVDPVALELVTAFHQYESLAPAGAPALRLEEICDLVNNAACSSGD